MTDSEPIAFPTPQTAGYSKSGLAVALVEAQRGRAQQSARIASLQNRAGILIGSSGLAAGLTASAADNAWWVVAIGFFLVAATFGMLSIRPVSGKASNPPAILDLAEGKTGFDMQLEMLGLIASEYVLEEDRVKWPARFAKIATSAFLAAILTLFAIVCAASFAGPSDEPLQVEITNLKE
jgi:hypothetical protein